MARRDNAIVSPAAQIWGTWALGRGFHKCAVVAALAFLSLTHAPTLQAATITEAFTAPDIDNVPPFGPGGVGSFSQAATFINQFSPALGVLTSVSVSVVGQFDFPGGGSSDMNGAAIGVDVVGYEFANNAASRTGSGVVEFDGFLSTSDPTILALFTGLDQLMPIISGTNVSPTSTLSVSSISGKFVYTYTAVPEPGSFALLTTGFLVTLLGVGFRQRLSLTYSGERPARNSA